MSQWNGTIPSRRGLTLWPFSGGGKAAVRLQRHVRRLASNHDNVGLPVSFERAAEEGDVAHPDAQHLVVVIQELQAYIVPDERRPHA